MKKCVFSLIVSLLLCVCSCTTANNSTFIVDTTSVVDNLIDTDISCSIDNYDASKIISVAATSNQHSEILECCRNILEKQGYFLDIKIADDYVFPNLQVENFVVLANYFQHAEYLNAFNKENGTHLMSVAVVHYEPFGLYAGKSKSLDSINNALIAVPDDTRSMARALLLLEQEDIISIKDSAGLTATLDDIEENAHNIRFVPIESSLIPCTLSNVDFAVMNPNYAAGYGITATSAIIVESSSSVAASTYGSIIAVREENKDDERVKALTAALMSDEVTDFILKNYHGYVLPIGNNSLYN